MREAFLEVVDLSGYLGILALHLFTLGPEWSVASMQGKLLPGLWTNGDAEVP